MFPSILSVAVAHISITDDDKRRPSRTKITFSNQVQNDKTTEKHKQDDSLLSVLDDKNKVIDNLRKHLENQKMQLTYYIQKDLSRSKITELSQSCMPQASEDSLPLNLAINKFCRQSGIKTKLLLLHERMAQLDYKIAAALKDQEFILRKIVNKLCEFVKVHQPTSKDFKERFGSFVSDPADVSLFDKLLTATIALGSKLDSFKICCDRVLLIEEERNAIVEQVYSIPVEQRISRTYLAEVQLENVHLQNELRRIFEQQSADKHRIKELNLIEKILNNLQWELNSTYLKNEESCISKLLKKINSEARVLLEMTKEQKRKFECELSKTKCPEPNRVLLFINVAAGAQQFDKDDLDRWGIKTVEEIKFFELVKTEVDVLKAKLKKEAEKEVEKSRSEAEALRGKLTQVMLDHSRTKITNKSLKVELDELKIEQRTAIQRLKQERDAYKSQVEDLQAIREAYAQLVEKQPNGSHVERKLWQDIDEKEQKLKDLQMMVASQSDEIAQLKNKIADQKDQILVLNKFINLTRPNSPKVIPPSSQATALYSAHLQLERRSDPTAEHLNNQKNKLSFDGDVRDDSSGSNTCCYKKSQKKNDDDDDDNDDERKLKAWDTLRCRRFSRSCSPILKTSKYRKSVHKLLSTSIQNLPQKESSSWINFISLKNKHSKDVFRTMLASGEVVDNCNKTRGNSSVFSVEIKYKNSGINSTLLELDESELFKDVSQESVVLESRFGRSTKHKEFQ